MNNLIKQVSLVIPMKNEAENVAFLLEEIANSLKNHTYEIIVVDDASQDDTFNRLSELQPQYPLKIVRHRESCGQSTAIWTGVKHAQYEWIATIDGDGQNDPSDIPVLINLLTDEKTMVIGNRRAQRQDSFIKRQSSIIANSIRSALLNDNTSDSACGLKVLSKKMFLELPYFDHMHRFMPALVKRQGGAVISRSIRHRHRQFGHSNYGTLGRLIAGICDLFGVFWLQKRTKHPEIEVQK